MLQNSVGFASIAENLNGTIFCKLELGSRPHHSIAIGRQEEAALAELQGRRSALGLEDLQICLQNLSRYRRGGPTGFDQDRILTQARVPC